MRRTLIHGFFAISALLLMQASLPSCTSSKHCPAVAGTGNSATYKGGHNVGTRKAGCAGVNGTGNYKPKLKNKREDGLTSAKMERQMAKAQKSSPIEGKTLSVDQ